MISLLNNLSHLPTFPAPWRIENGVLKDATGKRVSAAGINVSGYCNMPSSKAQATSWATKLKQLGVRVYRAHHIDILWRDHKTAHLPRLQWMFDTLERQGIPVIIEFASTHELYDKNKLAKGEYPPGWVEWVKTLCSMNLSNVVAACPVNEPPPTTKAVYDAQCKTIRSAGFKGILFGSCGEQFNNPVGELSDWHIYCAHDTGIAYQTDFYHPRFFDDMPAHHKPRVSKLPIIATEIGHLWPAPERGISERQIVDALLKVGCQVLCPFQLVNDVKHWNVGSDDLSMWNMSDDPIRMDTLAYIAHRMAGLDYIPDTFTRGFFAHKTKTGTPPYGDVWSTLPQVPEQPRPEDPKPRPDTPVVGEDTPQVGQETNQPKKP